MPSKKSNQLASQFGFLFVYFLFQGSVEIRNDAGMIVENPSDDFRKQSGPKNEQTTTASAQIFCGVA